MSHELTRAMYVVAACLVVMVAAMVIALVAVLRNNVPVVVACVAAFCLADWKARATGAAIVDEARRRGLIR